MPSNYSDSPSMDEILERIKRALSDRETKSSYYEKEEHYEVSSEYPTNKRNSSLSFEEMKELSSSREMTNKIVQPLADDDIFIKPVITQKTTEDEIIKPLKKSEKLNQAKINDDVFVLTKSMKINHKLNFENVDLDKLYKNISLELGRDLAIAYLSPKIESWFKINMPDMIKKSQNK